MWTLKTFLTFFILRLNSSIQLRTCILLVGSDWEVCIQIIVQNFVLLPYIIYIIHADYLLNFYKREFMHTYIRQRQVYWYKIIWECNICIRLQTKNKSLFLFNLKFCFNLYKKQNQFQTWKNKYLLIMCYMVAYFANF